ncbi:MAG: hypothetical protein NT133_11140 [Alphaproteobacteria bacterium]|nr:hypothetical protein [Alphaproteobacteria bacterium]
MADTVFTTLALLAGIGIGWIGAAMRRPAPPEAPLAPEDTRAADIAGVLGRTTHDIRGALSPAMLMTERLEGHADPAVREIAEAISRAMDQATATCRAAASEAKRLAAKA